MVYEYKKNAEGHFVCPHCGETKRLQSTMHYHLKRHEGKLPHECKLCKKSFLHASTLDLHMKAQHQKEQARMFKCPMPGCPYDGTLTKANLLIHYVRKHCKEEAAAARADGDSSTHVCNCCNKSCNSLTAFHYHVATCFRLEDAVRQQHIQTILG
jgi:hypothetical protein